MAGYAPGLWPDNLVSWSAPSLTSLSVTLHMNAAYATQWMLYNQLSEIHGDARGVGRHFLTGAPGSGGCGKLVYTKAVAAACTKVWTFDTDNNGKSKSPHMAGDLASYATNPCGRSATALDAVGVQLQQRRGDIRAEPGVLRTAKAYLSKFIEVPFLSDTSEFAALAAGGSSGLQEGYAPAQNIPLNNGPVGSTAQTPLSFPRTTTCAHLYLGHQLLPENFNSIGDNGAAGAIFRQLYFRRRSRKVSTRPGSSGLWTRATEYRPMVRCRCTRRTPSFRPKSRTTCTRTASRRGKAAVESTVGRSTLVARTPAPVPDGPERLWGRYPKGAPLSFTEPYASGAAAITETVDAETSAWSQMGINITSKAEPFDTVIGSATPCPSATVAKSACTWEMANWGGGWEYSPTTCRR